MTTRKSITNNGIIIFKDQLSTINLLPDDVVGAGLKLLLSNFDTMEPTENIFYELIASNVRRYREVSDIFSDYGKLGGNPTLKGRVKGRDNGTLKQQDNTIQEIKEKETNKEKSRSKVVDDGWYPNQTTVDKLKQLGYDVDKVVEYFINGCKAKKIKYVDYNRALLNWNLPEHLKKPKESKKPVYMMDDGRTFDHQPMPKWNEEKQQYIWE